MKKYNLILGLAVPFFLISCGSSDSNSDSNSSHVTGNYITVAGHKPSKIQITEETNNYKNLVVNGESINIDILVADLASDKLVRHSTLISDDSKYQDLVFGIITDNIDKIYSGDKVCGVKEQGIAFSQGNETKDKDMPTSGVFTYKGDAIIALSNEYKPPYTHRSSASFDVDFKKKTLTGSIGSIKIPGSNLKIAYFIPIEAKIEGNKFAGENENVDTKGGFYGPNAQEMSGVFKSKNGIKNYNVTGAFGAVKPSTPIKQKK